MPFSPTDHVHAARRTVAVVTRDDAEMRLVTVARSYDAEPADVWSAVTTADRIGRWLGPVSGDLELGGRFQVEGNAAGEVLECVEPERLAVTWEYAGGTSYVDLTLRPVDGGTLLQIDHTVPLDDHYARFGPGAGGIGWELALIGMSLHLADPAAPLPAPGALPDLRDLMTAAGTAWGEAAAAGGDDPRQASEAAERCVAFYTGG